MTSEIQAKQEQLSNSLLKNLQQEKAFLQTILDASPIFIVAIDSEGKTLLMNRQLLETLEYSLDEVIGLNYVENFVPKEDRKNLLSIFAKIYNDEESTLSENKIISKSGKIFLTEWHGKIVKERDNKDSLIIGIGIDITERKKISEELQTAKRLKSIAKLTGGIAHAFNNLLMVVRGNAELTLRENFGSNPYQQRLERIMEQADIGASLTSQLLSFAQEGTFLIYPSNMNNLLEAIFKNTERVSVHKKLQTDLWLVNIDSEEFKKALGGLYQNALHAMPAGGEIRIKTTNTTLDKKTALFLNINPGPYVKIIISDTGHGMDKRTSEQIFEPFFSTQKMGRGTGLGLATTYGIIKSHFGAITVSSELDIGTTFVIYLPSIKKEKEITVLLIDDDLLVLEITIKFLKSLGYKVLVAENGREGIAIYQNKKSQIDLIMLDVNMPDMSGKETFTSLRNINPLSKILIFSGYDINEEIREILRLKCDGFIQKPFKRSELHQRIKEILVR